MLRVQRRGGLSRLTFPLLSGIRRVDAYHRGVWCREESSKDETVAQSAARFLSSHSPLPPATNVSTPRISRLRRPSATAFVVATLFSGEIPRSAIYIFDVASSTPLMLLVRNLPLTCVPRCSFSSPPLLPLVVLPSTNLSPSAALSARILCAFLFRNVTAAHVCRTAI